MVFGNLKYISFVFFLADKFNQGITAGLTLVRTFNSMERKNLNMPVLFLCIYIFMRNGLEGKVNQGDRNSYKSEGERKIADFLGCNNIRYLYEAPVLINSYDSKARIWYPDFYLPEFKTYIEYYGLAGNPEYDRGIKKKELSYKKSGVDVITLYPRMFRNNWREYIMQELESNILRRYHDLMAKPYWSKNKPSLNSHRSEFRYRRPTIRLY